MAVKKKSKTKKKAIKKKPSPNKNSKGHFVKGNKAGVGYGRPKMTPEQKAQALATRTQFKTVISNYLTMTKDQIEEQLERADLPAFDVMVLKSIQSSMNGGGQVNIDWFADHLYGKRADKQDINFSGKVIQDVDLGKLSKAELDQAYKIAKKCQND